MKIIDIYFEASAYPVNTELSTHINPNTNATTNMYLKQNNPSLITILHRFLQSINMSSITNKHNNENDNL